MRRSATSRATLRFFTGSERRLPPVSDGVSIAGRPRAALSQVPSNASLIGFGQLTIQVTWTWIHARSDSYALRSISLPRAPLVTPFPAPAYLNRSAHRLAPLFADFATSRPPGIPVFPLFRRSLRDPPPPRPGSKHDKAARNVGLIWASRLPLRTLFPVQRTIAGATALSGISRLPDTLPPPFPLDYPLSPLVPEDPAA